MNERRRHGAAGYSLLELMITLVVLSVILAMTIPVAQRALHQSHRGRMLHNMRAIMDDQLMYQRDHGSFYPTAVESGGTLSALQINQFDQPMTLEGQGMIMPAGSRRYTYYIIRDEPLHPEPILMAYANQSFANDLDGDAFPDVWIKYGTGPTQLYYDDFRDVVNTVTP